MLISEKVLEKTFTAEKMKDAYLKACKWVSSNIIAINNFENVTIKYVKQSEGVVKTVKVILYITTEEKEVFERTCNICRECSSLFYLAENKNKCANCAIEPYRKRELEKLKNIKEGLKGKIL